MMVVLILVMMHHTRVLRERERNKTNYILDCDGRLHYSNVVKQLYFIQENQNLIIPVSTSIILIPFHGCGTASSMLISTTNWSMPCVHRSGVIVGHGLVSSYQKLGQSSLGQLILSISFACPACFSNVTCSSYGTSSLSGWY